MNMQIFNSIKMSVDVFGRTDAKLVITSNTRGLPGIGYKLTPDGQYDISKKRLCNLAEPMSDDDAVNLHVMKKRMTESYENFKPEIEKIMLKSDSDTSFIIRVIEDLIKPISKNIEKIKNNLEDLTHEFSILTNRSIKAGDSENGHHTQWSDEES